jgi:hypothetical protein
MALLPKDQPAQFVSEALNLLRLCCIPELLGELEELLLLPFLCLDPFFYELHQNPVRTETPLPGEATHLTGCF